jgi:hypothetical protein
MNVDGYSFKILFFKKIIMLKKKNSDANFRRVEYNHNYVIKKWAKYNFGPIFYLF